MSACYEAQYLREAIPVSFVFLDLPGRRETESAQIQIWFVAAISDFGPKQTAPVGKANSC
jgi:hypothetical protein